MWLIKLKISDCAIKLGRKMSMKQIRTMVLIVMNLHGRSIDVRLKCLKGIVQIRHGIRVGGGRNGDGGGQSGGFLKDFTTGVGGFCVV